MTIKDFVKRMSEKYDLIYDYEVETGKEYPGARIAAYAFDQWAMDEENKVQLERVAKYRGDFISSDREAAAFMFVLEEIRAI